MSKLNSTVRPTVSVVIATYNRASMVRETVLAAWNQSRRPDEIVVSDDCSSDNTLIVLRELQREVPILKIVESGTNSGGVPNWNQVVNASSGDIIAWCSDDDRFKTNHLETAFSYLLSHNEVDMIHAGFEEVFDDGQGGVIQRNVLLKSKQPIIVNSTNAIDYFSDNFSWPFHPSTLVFHRRLWKAVGPFHPKYALADTEWFLRAAVSHRIVYLPYYGVVNRRHCGGAGNWSARVGSINMQREQRESIYLFYDTVQGKHEIVPRLSWQLSKWTMRYRILLTRIFIARSRASAFSVAEDCASEILHVTPILLLLPRFLRTAIVNLVYFVLSRVQPLLPGGKAKYADLGKYTPM